MFILLVSKYKFVPMIIFARQTLSFLSLKYLLISHLFEFIYLLKVQLLEERKNPIKCHAESNAPYTSPDEHLGE